MKKAWNGGFGIWWIRAYSRQKLEKQELSEIDICDLFITPAIKDAGWDQLKQIRREVTLTPGPVVVRGNMSSRNKKKKKFADYVLQWEAGVPIAIIEAKDNKHSVSQGMQQALGYAGILQVPSTFSSNGDAFASHNKVPAKDEDIETEFPLAEFPAPDILWNRYKKYRKIDPSYEVYLGLYQALTGPDEADKIFKSVSRDFFDLIVIDECHRGSASEDSAWREILDYFSGATQIGLTATPKETKYASNITYFGDPIYSYTLKQGIEDGFLAPYKVVRYHLDRDLEGWTPPAGMTDDLGVDIPQREYNQADMDRILILNQRTKLVAKCVMELLNATDPFSKTIIFCEDIDHAERMRVAIINAAGQLAIKNPKYVMRITGDSVEGKAELDNFIDPESKFPVIATTSELLTTGVDAKTCKLIVLDKTINSMTTFKQIVGRGTRIEEEHNKFFFTVMDFKNATKLFSDPDFDGDPVVIYEPRDDDDPVPPDPDPDPDDGGDMIIDDPPGDYNSKKITVSGVEVKILSKRVEYRGDDGQMVTESYRDYSRKNILKEYASLDEFVTKWNATKKKSAIVEELEEYGIELDKLADEVGKDYGDFDLICHIAYDAPALTRKERAENVTKRNYFTKYGDQARAVLEALLQKYADEGVLTIESPSVLKLNPFDTMGTPVEIINDVFGGKANYESALADLERELFQEASTA
jgi:type I restriction enzyme R subunit